METIRGKSVWAVSSAGASTGSIHTPPDRWEKSKRVIFFSAGST